MLKMLLIISLVLLNLVSGAVLTQPASFVTELNFTAGTATLVSSEISAPQNLDFPVYYTRGMTSNPPNIAFGIKSYSATDFLVQQFFSLTLTSADQSQFVINLVLEPITTPTNIQISYLAVEASYPYLNAISSIQFNGGSPLTNFSTISSTPQSQTQIINYSTLEYYISQSVAAPTLFSTPLSNNVIAFYLTALYIIATQNVVLQIDVSYSIIDVNNYSMTVTAGNNLTITQIAYSKIFFDSSLFSLGARNYLTAYDWQISNPNLSSNFFALPATVCDNQLIIGIKNFKTFGQNAIIFNWISGPYNSSYGVLLASSSVFTRYSPQVVYYMKWSCPNGFPYTDLTSFLCQDSCPPYYYPDPVDLICKPCNNTLCYTCNNTNTSICTSCATNFVLNSDTCDCDMSSNSKILISDNTCYICSNLLANCILCDYTGSNSLAYNASQFVCLDCNSAANYFLNSNSTCSLCSLSNCVLCASLTKCKTCIAGYGTNSSGICSTCPIDYCTTCYNLTACKVCSGVYILMANYTCATCPASCTCGGYTFPRKANGDCSTICGDGIIIYTYQGCDDNNTLDGDGCSSTCQIQSNSNCSGTPSICYYTGPLAVNFISTSGVIDNCNQIIFTFQIAPYLLFFKTYPINWTQLITTNSNLLTQINDSFITNQDKFSLAYTYNQTIHKTTINFTLKPSALNKISSYLNKTVSFNLSAYVDPKNDIAAVFCTSPITSSTSLLISYMTAQNFIAYIGLFMSIFSLKIVGLQMFGALQLSYLILSDYDYINPVFRQILGRNQVNGINSASGSTGSPSMSYRVIYNGFNSQIFLQNFNVMFYITIALVIGGFIMYSITYILNKTIQKSILNDTLKQKEQSIHSELSNSKIQVEQTQPKSAWFHRLSKYILKQVLMTFIIFNMFNMSFSAGLQMKYVNVVEPSSIIAMLVSFVMVISLMIAQIITDKIQFGEYIDKFNKDTTQSNYMIMTIIYRFTLGLLMALLNQWSNSGIVFTFISGAFLTYIFYCEPFVDQIQNLRSKSIHSVHVLMMFINHYYRQQANFDQVDATQFLFPAYLQVVVVGLVVFVSSLMLGYEVFMKIKTTFFSSKQQLNQAQNIFSNMQVQNNQVQLQTHQEEQIQG